MAGAETTNVVASLSSELKSSGRGGEGDVRDDEPVQQLFAALAEDIKGDPNGPNVKQLMAEYASKYTDWKDYVHFCEHKYARNLVNANEYLELIILCWLPHQQSPIHNHAGQHCWAAVLEGNMQEKHFLYKNTNTCTGCGPLTLDTVMVHPEGTVSYIDDGIALHMLQPTDGKRGITMHAYSRPITCCNIYDAATGCMTARKSGFFTIKKKLQPMDQQCVPCTAASPTTATAPQQS